MATNQQMREGEAELARIVRAVDHAAGEAMASQTGFCTQCRGGVLEKRGSRFRCRTCRAMFPINPSAPQPAPQGPPQGHRTTKSRRTRDRHTDSHPSRTGQKKKLNVRRTDKKKRKKRQKESEGEMELARVLQEVDRAIAEAEWESGEAMARRTRVLPGQLGLPGIPPDLPHPPSHRRTGGPPRRPGPAIMTPRPERRPPDPPPVDPRQLPLRLPDEEMADMFFEGFY